MEQALRPRGQRRRSGSLFSEMNSTLQILFYSLFQKVYRVNCSFMGLDYQRVI